MKTLQTYFSSAGFRDVESNDLRFNMIRKLVELSKRKNADLLILPGGVLTVNSIAQMNNFIDSLSRLSSKYGITIIGGIDVARNKYKSLLNKSSITNDDLVKKGKLPYYSFAVSDDVKKSDDKYWRQISTNSRNALLTDNIGGRTFLLNGYKIGLFLCGEIFSNLARKKIGAENPDIIIDIGHKGMGQGLIPAMRSASSHCDKNTKNAFVLHSQHLSDWNGRSAHSVSGNGQQLSKKLKPKNILYKNDFWASYEAREI